MKPLFIFIFTFFVCSNAAVIPAISENGLNVTLKNNTEYVWYLGGVRFQNGGFKWQGVEGAGSYLKLINIDNYQDIYYTENAPIYNMSKLIPENSHSFLHHWVSSAEGAEPISESECVLLKTGSFGVPEIPASEKFINIEQIDSLLLTTNYYNSLYRYVDSLGRLGGPYSGGFLDTWKDETQILFPYKGQGVSANTNNLLISGDSSNLMYWISLILGQEFFNVDMQLLAAIGIKESWAGTPLYKSQMGSSYGPFQLESYTGIDKAMAFPTLFPEYCMKLQSAYDVTTSGINVSQFMNDYHNGNVELNDATIICNYIFSICFFYSDYNVLSYATDICWKEVLDGATDERFGLSTLIAAHSLGMWSQIGSIAAISSKDTWQSTNLNENASSLVSPGNNNYRAEIFGIIDSLISASKKSAVDLSVELWDPQIKWFDLERLFLGDGGTISNQGTGGLLKHLTVSDMSVRTDIMQKLETAFEKLKGKAPSTAGTENISFRYDLLTILRTVKMYFQPSVFYRKVTSGDASILIPQYSTGSGCDSDFSDSLYPFIKNIQSTISSNITINANFEDDNSIKEVKWTADSLWVIWNDAEYVSGTGGSQNFKITVPEEYKGNVEKNSDLITDVWIMVTDEDGKSTIKKERFQESVEIKKPIKNGSLNLNVKMLKNQIRIDFNKNFINELTEIELFSLNGKKIKTIQNLEIINQAVIISAETISSGTYLMRIKGKNSKNDFKICITE